MRYRTLFSLASVCLASIAALAVTLASRVFDFVAEAMQPLASNPFAMPTLALASHSFPASIEPALAFANRHEAGVSRRAAARKV